MVRIKKGVYLLLLLLLVFNYCKAQYTYGKITYERRTNLFKKYDEKFLKMWNIAEKDKIKLELFELYFNDSLSYFSIRESGPVTDFNQKTSKNTVYQNLKSNSQLTIKTVDGENLTVQDTLHSRQWKITESTRTICGHLCRMAIWKNDEGNKIYAWYTGEIITGTGPENFIGLPGAILGVATENGSVVYFAKKIEFVKPDIALLQPKKTKEKIYSLTELKAKFDKEFGKYEWGKYYIKLAFEF